MFIDYYFKLKAILLLNLLKQLNAKATSLEL